MVCPIKTVFALVHCLFQADDDVKLPAIRMKTKRRNSHYSETQCLFPKGSAVVIGLPQKFNLGKRLEEATQIRLATAFAHVSGWRLLAPYLQRSIADIQLIAGLDYFQTEPEVLRKWLRFAKQNERVQAYLAASHGPMFHPKVLIANSRHGRFAIVGSGNLSAGGLRDNIECSVFVEDENLLAGLSAWFDGLLGNSCTILLHESDIAAYQVLYDKTDLPRSRVNVLQHQVERRVAIACEARTRLCHVVNTNSSHDRTACRHMLDNNRVSAFWGKKRTIDRIQKGNRVLLYHNKVGVIACGNALAGFQVDDYGDGNGEEHFVPVNWTVKVYPDGSPEKAVSIREIKTHFKKVFLFRTTRREISEKVARFIEDKLKERVLK